MAFCTKCGKELNEESVFCPYCGQAKGEDPIAEAPVEKQEVKEYMVFGILAYLGILVLIPLFGAPKKSAYCRFHTNQGLVLWIASLILDVLDIALGIVGGLLGIFGIVAELISGAGGIFILVLMIIGIVNAVKGEQKELPLIGQFKILK